MAMKLSTKKRPEREDKMLKEHQGKFSERTFDNTTIRTLKYLMTSKVFTDLDFPIQHGKEAAVYRATNNIRGKTEFLAVKIFKFEGPSFMKRMEYLEGDRRFPKSHGRRDMVRIFARKEFANLQLCKEAGIRVPRPVRQKENVVVMEFLGEEGVPSDLLKGSDIKNPHKLLSLILEDMRRMHDAKIVHADLSEFNIIMHKGMPYIIDVGQAVMSHHPKAEEYLTNDLTNLLKFFGKHGAVAEFRKALDYVVGNSDKFD